MINFNTVDCENLELLVQQRNIVLRMSPEKRAKHLAKIDSWIEEIEELVVSGDHQESA